MNTDINKIKDDGFSLVDRDKKLKNLAVVSLKIALQAYFSTYEAMQRSLGQLEGSDQEEIDAGHTNAYCQNCAEAILHFQHFAELVCKDLLRAENDLLAIDATQRPVILHKLLNKENVSEPEYERINTVEFGEALNRLCELIKAGRIGVGKLEFFVSAKSFLEALNNLRNREWHRGAFILRYPALDALVGEHVLPFVKKVVALPEYSDLSGYWKYQDLACGVDPIEEIIHAWANIKKIAMLKELGRAAYENPLYTGPYGKCLNEEHHRHAQQLAESEVQHGDGSAIKDCPVCGFKSLVLYNETLFPEDCAEPVQSNKVWSYTYEVKCMCCSFEVNDRLDNPIQYNLDIEDFWKGGEL